MGEIEKADVIKDGGLYTKPSSGISFDISLPTLISKINPFFIINPVIYNANKILENREV